MNNAEHTTNNNNNNNNTHAHTQLQDATYDG